MPSLRIVRSSLQPYCLPLRQPWRSAHGVLNERRGWLVRLDSTGGLSGYGDCAPLPEMGSESADAALARLQAALPVMRDGEPATLLESLEPGWMATPTARCAIETALVDLLAQAAGLPLARWLNPGAAMSPRANAVIGGLDSNVATRAAEAVTQGYAVLKLKVGVAEPESELQALHGLADTLPAGVVLRLDANGAWTEAAALRFIQGLAVLPVEALEEPLTAPGRAALARLQAAANFPLALDETLVRPGRERWVDTPVTRRVVLKPTLLGGPLAAYKLAGRARRTGLECVATTTLDSAVGTWAACHLAAALANDLAHGVATGAMLAEDVGYLPHCTSGQVILDNTVCGLGFFAFSR